MGPELELRGTCKLETLTEATVSNDNVSVPPDSVAMHCTSNYEDTGFDIDTALEAGHKMDEGENVVVDVTDCTKTNDAGQIDGVIERDSTENSSSFGGTHSGAENGATLSDDEVNSQGINSHGINSQGMAEGIHGSYSNGVPDESLARKKKLTDHWRRFIHPLGWRCKWLELQMKEIQSRAVEYDKLAECKRLKYCAFDSIAPEGFSSKSLAFCGQIQRNNVLKRNKRRKVEETVDVVSYMSNHNLFSHVEKRSAAYRNLVKDGSGNQDATRDIVDLGSDDKPDFGVSSDTSVEQILAKIYMAQSEAQKLKTRIEKVISENPGRFSSINRLTVGIQSSAAASSYQNPPSPLAQHQSDCDIGDLLLGDASSRRGTGALPDVRESTNQSDDGILINNLAVKEELINFEKVVSRPSVNPKNINHPKQVEEDQTTAMMSPAKVLKTALPVESPSPLEASNVKPRTPLKTNVSKRKRKRRPINGRKKSKKS